MRRALALLLTTLLLPLAAAGPVPSLVPSAPEGLTATGGVGRIDLAWSAPSDPGTGVTAYRVYRDGAHHATTSANATTFADVGLGASETHTYVVTAVGILLAGSPSGNATATTSATPAAPTGLTAKGGLRSVSLRWSSAPADAFRVYRDGALVAEVSNRSFVDAPLADATTYAYAVSAVEAGVESALSATVHARTADSPDAPRSLVAKGAEEAIDLKWLPPLSGGGNGTGNQTGNNTGNGTGNGTVTYRVYADLGGWTLLGETTLTSYRDAPLAAGTTRTYRVTATTAAKGESAPTNASTATAYGEPSAPRDLAATAGNASIHLEWLAPADDGASPILNYNVYRVHANGTRTLVGQQSNATTFDDYAAPPGESRTYVVTAVNAAGEGPESNEASATRPAPAYGAAAPRAGPPTWSPRVVLRMELRA